MNTDEHRYEEGVEIRQVPARAISISLNLCPSVPHLWLKLLSAFPPWLRNSVVQSRRTGTHTRVPLQSRPSTAKFAPTMSADAPKDLRYLQTHEWHRLDGDT